MPRMDENTFVITWAGELTEIREFVGCRGTTVYITPVGSGAGIRFEVHQVTPKLGGNRFIARLGDTLRYERALLVVDRLKAATPEVANTPEPQGLFDIDASQVRQSEPEPGPFEGLSADQRRTLRQSMDLEAGRHPLTKGALHEEAAPADDRKADGRRCGNCFFRTLKLWHNKTFVKCAHPGSMGADEISVTAPPRVTHGAATDVRSWWPACLDHVYGESQLSDDAARYVPEAVTADA